MTQAEKTLPFALLARYWGLRPRLQSCLARLRQHTAPTAPANAVEQALVAELIREARAITSRDSFGRALPLLPPGPAISRSALLARLEEAETALVAFQALYHGGVEVEPEDEDAPYWRVEP